MAKKNKNKTPNNNARDKNDNNAKNAVKDQSRYSFPDTRERRDGPGGEDGNPKG